MKAFLTAVVATVVLGVAAYLVLGVIQRPAYEVYATAGTRVGDPGENLVGKNWSGLNEGGNVPAKHPTSGQAE